MKEVDLIPDDPKAAECIKQLAQVIMFLNCFCKYLVLLLNKILVIEAHAFYILVLVEFLLRQAGQKMNLCFIF